MQEIIKMRKDFLSLTLSPVKAGPSHTCILGGRYQWIVSHVRLRFEVDAPMRTAYVKAPLKSLCVLHFMLFTNEHQIGWETRIFKNLEPTSAGNTCSDCDKDALGSEGTAERQFHCLALSRR